jgi:hypothetical protein
LPTTHYFNASTVSLEAVDSDKKPVVSAVDIVEENGAWKMTNAVERDEHVSIGRTRHAIAIMAFRNVPTRAFGTIRAYRQMFDSGILVEGSCSAS